MRVDKNTTGNISEALVMAAFQMDGVKVAIPFGGHERYDLLAKIDGCWREVQIKAAQHGRCSGFCFSLKTSRNSKMYLAGEVDLFVAVYPETGRMWKIPAADAVGKTGMGLSDRYLWKAGASAESGAIHPEPINHIPYEPYRPRKSYLRVLLEPHAQKLEGECPEGVSQQTWEAARLHVNGMGLWKAARHFHRDATTIAESMERMLLGLGWATRDDLKRLTAHPRVGTGNPVGRPRKVA